MPRSAMPATFLASTTVNQYRQRELADKRTQPQGTEDRARYEIAEDGIEAEPAHQWNDDARSAEQDKGIAVDGNVDRRGHLSRVRQLASGKGISSTVRYPGPVSTVIHADVSW